MRLLNALNRSLINTKQALQFLEDANLTAQRDYDEAATLADEAEYAAFVARNAVTSPATVRTPGTVWLTEIETESRRVIHVATASRSASALYTGRSAQEQQVAEYRNENGGQAARCAEQACALYRFGGQDNAVQFTAGMAMICAGNIVRCVELLQPKPVSRLVITA